MGVLNSLFSALLMYSRIPAPKVEWKEENRRYALCFFPAVGVVIGGLLLLWAEVSSLLDAGELLFAAGAAVIPMFVTGGIHMDGFCDVLDAKSSYAPKEKKLQIMSDPHIGAFAVMGMCVYFLLQFALFTECSEERLLSVIGLGYPMSRALSGLAAVTFRCAKKQGSLQDFVRPAHRRISAAVLAGIAVLCAAGMTAVLPAVGAAAAAAAVLVFLYYRRFSYRVFGGITGDLAGYFVQICELAVLAVVTAGGLIAA